MSKYLLEIGTEELPANFSHAVLNQFRSLLEFEFDKKLIKFEKIFCTSTPRRIVLLVEGLVDQGEDEMIITKGPKASIAFINGTATKAALGFANSLGIDVDELKIENTEKGEFVFGKKVRNGESTRVLLSLLIPKVIKSLQGPRFMKWGNGNFKFSRPIRWLVSIYNNEILNFTLDECDPIIEIGNISKGHRLIDNVVEIYSPDNYFEIMEENGVLVKREERKEKIRSIINQSSDSLNLKPDLSDGLINELCDLVEFPNLIVGKFDKEFLDLPVEVLSTVMKSHQRYIPLLQKGKTLSKLNLTSEQFISTNFLLISNGLHEANNIIAKGNEKVLKARFSDAKFFVESDKKVSSGERNEKLKSVSHLKGMGNVFQRVERINFIASKVTKCLNDQLIDDEKINDAANYCKNDLCSEIVYEFPELQGIMGGKYLKHEGYSEEVCLAVAEHYLPSSYKDDLPSTKYGAIISIADKLENLISIFISGKRPSGSSDPYALRRSLNGVVKIIWNFELDFSLEKLLGELIEFWKTSLPNLNFNEKKVFEDLIDFLLQRIECHLEEIVIDKELIKAIISSDILFQKRILNITDLKNRIESIAFYKGKGSFAEIQSVISRVSKLASNGKLKRDVLLEDGYINKDLFEKQCELKVFELIKELEMLFSKKDWNYSKLLNLFEKNTKNLEELFDNEKGVLIMSEDITIRENRLNLIGIIRNYSLKIVDFTLL